MISDIKEIRKSIEAQLAAWPSILPPKNYHRRSWKSYSSNYWNCHIEESEVSPPAT